LKWMKYFDLVPWTTVSCSVSSDIESIARIFSQGLLFMIISDLMKCDCRTGLYVLHELDIDMDCNCSYAYFSVVITWVFQTQNASCFWRGNVHKLQYELGCTRASEWKSSKLFTREAGSKLMPEILVNKRTKKAVGLKPLYNSIFPLPGHHFIS
jgi:hypothetical protein